MVKHFCLDEEWSLPNLATVVWNGLVSSETVLTASLGCRTKPTQQ